MLLESVRIRIQERIFIDDNACWIWLGPACKDGYGRIPVTVSRGACRNESTHRASYEAFVGPIQPGLTIDHLCRNRICCNPAHLEPVTHRVNSQRGGKSLWTHCKAGHPLSGTNLVTYPNNPRRQRDCRICVNKRARDYSARKRAEKRA